MKSSKERLKESTFGGIARLSVFGATTWAEAARESDRLRTVLLDSVTHEFRTPLTAIKASAETLLSDVQLEAPQRKDLLAVINEEADRLNRGFGRRFRSTRPNAQFSTK